MTSPTPLSEAAFQDPGEWMLVQPGGPAGPFWGIISSSGPGWVVAMQVASKGFAELIISEHNDRMRELTMLNVAHLHATIDGLRADLTAAQEEIAKRDALLRSLEPAIAYAIAGTWKPDDFAELAALVSKEAGK